jgi:hypothetical protein
MNLLLDTLPPLIEFWDRTPTPPKDAWDISDVRAQWAMFFATVVAALFAGLAFWQQTIQLRDLRREQQRSAIDRHEESLRNRRSTGPYFKQGPRDTENVIVLKNRTRVYGEDYIPCADATASRSGFNKRKRDGGDLYLLLQNLRPGDDMIEFNARFINPPPGVSSVIDFYEIEKFVLEPKLNGEFWLMAYYANGDAFTAGGAASFEIKFETRSGHIDTHTYRTVIGQPVLVRTDPPGFKD